jgi:hypothetical protein
MSSIGDARTPPPLAPPVEPQRLMPAVPASVVPQPERPYWLDWVPVLVPTADYRLCSRVVVSADWDASVWAAMSPALVAGDVVPAEAVVLGDLLDGRAGADFVRGRLVRREGSRFS